MMKTNMQLIFERSREGKRCTLLPECDVPVIPVTGEHARTNPPRLPEVAETDISRHYTQLSKQTFGVNNGFYPLGSCTMKYNPKLNERMASLPGFTGIHPLQPEHTVQGAIEAMVVAEDYLNEITGMDAVTFQPAAGAHGELTGILMIKAYHTSRGDSERTKIIVPDAAHGTNPATASMCGYTVISIPSTEQGWVDIEKLQEAVGPDTAGLMLTNPNTIGAFDGNILEITKIIHDAGGLNYYDGANLNAVMGRVRPGDMGFDVIHLNLHKTMSTPHGGGGPGSGAVGCKNILKPFLPAYHQVRKADGSFTMECAEQSIGSVKAFYGNFLVTLRAMTYMMTLGAEGIRDASGMAVLNANYMRVNLNNLYDVAYDGICMHEFVLSLARLKKETGVTAGDVAKMLLDNDIHPPTMYFPLIVEEALMVEPTETESKETLDRAIQVFREIYLMAKDNPEALHAAPTTTPVRRLDEVTAARSPIIRYSFDN